jgi:hypothetical protein
VEVAPFRRAQHTGYLVIGVDGPRQAAVSAAICWRRQSLRHRAGGCARWSTGRGMATRTRVVLARAYLTTLVSASEQKKVDARREPRREALAGDVDPTGMGSLAARASSAASPRWGKIAG